MDKIKFSVSLTSDEALKCEDKAKELDFEFMENPKESQRKDKPYVIQLENDHDINAGLKACSEDDLHKLATKSYVIEKRNLLPTESVGGLCYHLRALIIRTVVP